MDLPCRSGSGFLILDFLFVSARLDSTDSFDHCGLYPWIYSDKIKIWNLDLVSGLHQDLNFGSGLYCVFLPSDLDLESRFRIGL